MSLADPIHMMGRKAWTMTTRLTQPRYQAVPSLAGIKGLITIAPGVDLTDPAFPDRDAYAEEHYGPDSELGQIWARAVEKGLKK